MINYYLLTKPGIIFGNLITVAAGFLLASKGHVDIWLFLATLAGLGLIIASACVFNNYIDRNVDSKMERTKDRPLVRGTVTVAAALAFAAFLGVCGVSMLYFYTNMLTVAIATGGFFVYVLLYSFWKGRTVYGTAIGSIAGAVPPVVGYCAVSSRLDLGAIIFFAMMILWQMPHFFSIALFRFEDYSKAGIPVLPVSKGVERTKVHMALYIISFILAAFLLTYFNYTGKIYLVVTLAISLLWLFLSIKGFSSNNDKLWGQQMFRLSLIVISAVCLTIPFDYT